MNTKLLLRAILGVSLFLYAHSSNAQGVAINTTGTAADTSAILDVNSTSKGLLIPRMTNAQLTAISQPATGLMVYQTDGTAGFYYNTGTPASPAWTILLPGGGNTGAVFHLSSGTPLTMTTGAVGFPINNPTVALLGFGSNISGFQYQENSPITVDSSSPIINDAFSVPRNGTITSLSMFFSPTTAFPPAGEFFTVSAQVYEASGNNTLVTIPGATVSYSFPAGASATGTISTNYITGLNIPVTPQTILLIVFSVESADILNSYTISGYASASINIQ
jgi:BclB C-terminal domain-containing protein